MLQVGHLFLWRHFLGNIQLSVMTSFFTKDSPAVLSEHSSTTISFLLSVLLLCFSPLLPISALILNFIVGGREEEEQEEVEKEGH